MPQRWQAIEDAQKAAWSDFAQALPNGTRILDLATGDGRVLRWMREERRDFELAGVDLAPTLPSAPEGTQTQGGVAMENLPFEDWSFDAVVSQFGFEYGDMEKAAAEIARVLAPGGSVGLMVHRGDGPILERNRHRRAEIDWVLGEKRLSELVSYALTADNGGAGPAAQVAGAIGLLGSRRFGETSPAWEIAEAMRRAIMMGESAGPASIMETLRAIEAQATNEIGRIESLAAACARADAREALLAAFTAVSLTLHETTTITEPSRRAFADFLTFG